MVLIAIDSNMAKRLPVVLSKGNKRSREAIRVDATRQQVLSSKLLSDTYDQLKERYQGTGNSHLISITKDIEEGADPDILVARKDFAFFCEYIDPMLKPALHHRLWHKHLITEESNKYLHRIVGGDISILSPRGSSKSTVLGLFLAWAVGIHAEIGKALQILYISANRDIAKAKCETIRNLITNSNYETIFPFVQPNPKKWSNEIWSIDRAAAGIATAGQEEFTMICAGIMGTITSKRCFTGDTLIQTNVGSIMLKWSHLYSDLKVKSFNHATGKTEYRKVEAIQRSKSNRLVEITTSQGHRICCTADHPIYTLQHGYTEAGVLAQGTELVISTEKKSNSVFTKRLSDLPTTTEAQCQRLHLSSMLFSSKEDNCQNRMSPMQRSIWDSAITGVRKDCVWFTKLFLFICLFKKTQVNQYASNSILPRMQYAIAEKRNSSKKRQAMCCVSQKQSKTKNIAEHSLPYLQHVILPKSQTKDVLLTGLFQCSTQSTNAWQGQQSLQKGRQLQQNLSGLEDTYLRTGWGLLLYLQSYRNNLSVWNNQSRREEDDKLISNSSYRPQSTKQCSGQLNNNVSAMSHQTSCHDKTWWIDTVSSIKLLGDREEYVYDIQVEGNNNFFANNILVHNCQLIAFDDLIKNPDEIATPAIREKMVRTLNYAIYPVLFPGGRKISINTRFRPDDVYVTEFIPAKGWTVLEQSAIIKRRELIQLQTLVAGLEGGVEDEEELLKDSSSSSKLTPVKDRLDVQSEGLSQSKVDDIESLGLAKIIDANNESLLGPSNDNVSETDSLSQDRNLLTRTHTTTDVVGHHLSDDNELYLDEEVSYWEEMWPLSHLDKLRNPETGDPIAFSFQFQNKIASVEGMGIAKEHIKYGHPPDYFDYYCIGCDLAVSKKHSADFTVFVLVGKIDNEFWVLDFWRGKLVGNQPKIEQLLRMYWDYAEDTNELSLNPYTALQITPWRIAIESVAYQASLQDDLTRELYHKHGLNHIVVMPHKMRGSKTAHVESVSGAFSNGLVTFNMGIDWTIFVKELIGVGGSEHDDCADALVIALQSLGVRKRLATFDEDDKAQAINAYEQRQRELHPMLGSWS